MTVRTHRHLWTITVISVLVTAFYVTCLVHPKWLPSYHPFHPNYSHLTQSYSEWSIGKSLSLIKQSLFGSENEIEGWYMKLHLPETHPNCHKSHNESNNQSNQQSICEFSFIFLSYVDSDPNLSISAIQFYDATNYRSYYYRRPLDDFQSGELPSYHDFIQSMNEAASASVSHPITPYNNISVSVGSSTLTISSVRLNESPQPGDDASAPVKLIADFHPSLSLPATPKPYFFTPTSHTVGALGFLPLSCFQQVMVMKLDVSAGSLMIGDQQVNLERAEAYLEKTWGMTFPTEYLWMHSTRFVEAADSNQDKQSSLIHSLFFSLAVVPVVGSMEIPGFVSTLVFNGTYMHFATQLGSTIDVEHSNDDQVVIRTYDATFEHELVIQLDRDLAIEQPERKDAWLYAAKDGGMKKTIRQQIGKDLCTVTLNRLVKTERVGQSSDADEFANHGYVREVLARAQTRSIGLEVMITPNGPLVQLVTELYSSIRPWLSGWIQITTPIISLSLSTAFLTAGARMIREVFDIAFVVRMSVAFVALISSALFIKRTLYHVSSTKQKIV